MSTQDLISPHNDGPSKKGIFLSKQNPWNTWLGDCSVVDAYLLDKPVNAKWFLAHYLNVFLRAVGQVRGTRPTISQF